MAQVLNLAGYASRHPDRVERVREAARRKAGHAASVAGAIRRKLLADLATWPRPFRERVGEFIEREAETLRGARGLRRQLEGSRGNSPEWYVCREWCCKGLPVAVVAKIGELRDESQAGALRSPEGVRCAQGELLAVLWLYGQRRIDRDALLACLVRHDARQLAKHESLAEELLEEARELEERVRGGVKSGPRKGQPYGPKMRAQIERQAEGKRWLVGEEQKAAERCRRRLADPAALVRSYTGCER